MSHECLSVVPDVTCSSIVVCLNVYNIIQFLEIYRKGTSMCSTPRILLTQLVKNTYRSEMVSRLIKWIIQAPDAVLPECIVEAPSSKQDGFEEGSSAHAPKCITAPLLTSFVVCAFHVFHVHSTMVPEVPFLHISCYLRLLLLQVLL